MAPPVVGTTLCLLQGVLMMTLVNHSCFFCAYSDGGFLGRLVP